MCLPHGLKEKWKKVKKSSVSDTSSYYADWFKWGLKYEQSKIPRVESVFFFFFNPRTIFKLTFETAGPYHKHLKPPSYHELIVPMLNKELEYSDKFFHKVSCGFLIEHCIQGAFCTLCSRKSDLFRGHFSTSKAMLCPGCLRCN